MTRRLTALVLLGALVSAGCGGSSRHGLLPTLPPSAVPYLPSSVRPLTIVGLAREVQAPTLRGKLAAWGFVSGSDRYFQGESRQLQVVDSRTLRFRDPGGAVAYVNFMRAHVAAILGSFPVLHTIFSRGRSGFVAVAQQCQCHLANPALLAVVVRARTVTWLEINGPGATRNQLSRLLAGAP